MITAKDIIRLCEDTDLLQVGQTVEQNGMRFHQYDRQLQVTDLANAGKRGKTVEQVTFGYNDRDTGGKYQAEILRCKNIEDVKRIADKLENETGVEVWKSTLKGIEVQTAQGAGKDPIEIRGDRIYVESSFDSFTVRDLEDRANEETLIPPMRAPKTAINRFYAMVSDNQDKIKGMNFSEIVHLMDQNRIDYHRYCAMD